MTKNPDKKTDVTPRNSFYSPSSSRTLPKKKKKHHANFLDFSDFFGPGTPIPCISPSSRPVHCIFGSKNPGQKPGQNSFQFFGNKSEGGVY